MCCVVTPPSPHPIRSLHAPPPRTTLPPLFARFDTAGLLSCGIGGVQEAMDADEHPDMLDFSDAADGLARTTSNVSFNSEMHHSRQPGISPPPPPPRPPLP